MQRASDIWRWDHDAERRRIFAIGSRGFENLMLGPRLTNARLDIGRLVGLFKHERVSLRKKGFSRCWRTRTLLSTLHASTAAPTRMRCLIAHLQNVDPAARLDVIEGARRMEHQGPIYLKSFAVPPSAHALQCAACWLPANSRAEVSTTQQRYLPGSAIQLPPPHAHLNRYRLLSQCQP